MRSWLRARITLMKTPAGKYYKASESDRKQYNNNTELIPNLHCLSFFPILSVYNLSKVRDVLLTIICMFPVALNMLT